LGEKTPNFRDMQIIDIENDGTCEYLGHGGSDGAAVFDHQGKQLWAYREFFVKDMTAGDIDGDGIKEFAALHNGIKMFDKAGKVLWNREKSGAYYQIEIVDTDGDGKPEIFNTEYGAGYISNIKGELLKKIEMPFYMSQFMLCQLPDKKGLGLLTVEKGSLWILDFEGKSHYKFEAPLSQFFSTTKKDSLGEWEEISAYETNGVWGKFLKDQPECLAAVIDFAGLNASVFYIYSKSGQLIYQEVIPDKCRTIAVLPQSDSDNTQSVLVGGRESVWRYKAK
jgi:hypothetical protein